MSTSFAVVDVETTGLSPYLRDRVVEVAVVLVDLQSGILDEYATLINPERDIGPTHIHRITASDVVGAPTFAEVAGDIAERLAGSVIAGHNVRFDIGFLRSEYERIGVPMPSSV